MNSVDPGGIELHHTGQTKKLDNQKNGISPLSHHGL
jgi:hypothetical protein